MIFQAHKGLNSERPENTVAAFTAAIEQGFGVIELDPNVTKDGKYVVLHDKSINRTGRNADGTQIENKILISEITYDEALQYDFGSYFAPRFAGEKLPLMSDVLALCAKHGVKIKFDNKIQNFDKEQLNGFLDLLAASEAEYGITADDLDFIKYICAYLPGCDIHYDGVITEPILQELNEIVTGRLVVWAPLYSKLTSWAKVEFVTPELCALIKKYAALGIWIIDNEYDFERAEAMGADVIETPGQVKPARPIGFVADTHIHSCYSHDSDASLEDICAAAEKAGISLISVTDHCDIEYAKTDRIKEPITASFEAVKELNAQQNNLTLCTGVEIGEGIWYPEIAKQVAEMHGYDIILGSVHAVRFPGYEIPYSHIDFTDFSQQLIDDYVAGYFEDMITMLQTLEFDVLTHLTCPLRYIVKKYGKNVNLEQFRTQIDTILDMIIEKGIALEVNTSTWSSDFPLLMPDADIIRRYYDKGGRIVTLASDAHSPDRLGNGFEYAVQALKEIGFRRLFYYKNRVAFPYEI